MPFVLTRSGYFRRLVEPSVAMLLILASSAAWSDGGSPAALQATHDQNGTLTIPAFKIPLSSWTSEQARADFIERLDNPLPGSSDIQETRREIDRVFYEPLVRKLQEKFHVNVTPLTIAGVQTDVLVPRTGIAPKNRSRVLINLHGGGFEVGARLGGLVESIPVAARASMRVISVDYRLAPENTFPAASEDVAAVYGALIRQGYTPRSIGIYGCSAGGLLTAQSVAWFEAHHLPAPGAVGILSSGANINTHDGDSYYFGTLLAGDPLRLAAPEVIVGARYFEHASVQSPLASPLYSASLLRRFPPSLIISGTRDWLLSSAIHTHSELIKAGAQSELHVWEGMRHCFFFWPDSPESDEAWNVIAQFFDRHLSPASSRH